MKRYMLISTAIISMVLVSMIGGVPCAVAQDINVYGSAQMDSAFIAEGTKAFIKDTGIKAVAAYDTSGAGVKAIIKGTCTIATVARKLKLGEKAQDKTLVETFVAKDPIAVYVDKNNPINQLSLADVQKVFTGQITDWKNVGGAAGSIQVAIPQTKTACNKNFKKAVMGDLGFVGSAVITPTASDTIEKVKGNIMAVSFISYGAVVSHPALKAIKVNGKNPVDPGYPVIQELYLVTKGQPAGDVKAYVDYFLTGAGKAIIQKNGMVPAQ
ncbi:MAG: substrate-binding domain-containing protein [Desulfobacterales bacterium]|nr:substrate-binding domain-containing protein [Desulfobacterales bacterium]